VTTVDNPPEGTSFMPDTMTTAEQAALARYSNWLDKFLEEMAQQQRQQRIPSASMQAARLHRWWAQTELLQAAGGPTPSAEFAGARDAALTNFFTQRANFLFKLAATVGADVPVPENEQGVLQIGGAPLGLVGFVPARNISTPD
jgi:hypothetical protein